MPEVVENSKLLRLAIDGLGIANGTEVSGLINGLVDKDNDPNDDLPSNVECLSRYCHENFYADPLVMFTLLVEEKETDVVAFADNLG